MKRLASGPRPLQHWPLWLLVLAVLCAGFGLRDPWPADEPRFALVARELWESGQWLLPTRGGEIYPDKPPLLFWLQAMSYALTRSWRAAFLLPSLLAGIAALGMVHDLARRLYGQRAAALATLLLLLSVQFTAQVKSAQIDGLLVGLTTVALYGMARYLLLGGSRGWLFLGCFFAGLGTIAKGTGGLALLFIPAWFLARRLSLKSVSPPAKRNAGWLGLAGFLLGLAPWLLPLLLTLWLHPTPELERYVREILFGQTVRRYLAADHHLEPVWYFVGVMATLWWPLVLALPSWLLTNQKRGWRKLPVAALSMALYALLLLLFFSCSSGKRGVYILPALPALALALAPWLVVLYRKRSWHRSLSALALALGSVVLLAAGIGWLFSPGYAQRIDFALQVPHQNSELASSLIWPSLCLIGLISASLAWFWRHDGTRSIAAALASIWIGFGLLIAPEINAARSARGLMESARDAVGPDATLGLLNWKEQQLLQALGPTQVFGFLRPRAEQELAAAAWLREAPEERKLLLMRVNLHACFIAEKARYLGRANRREYYLADARALRPHCLEHDAEARAAKRHANF